MDVLEALGRYIADEILGQHGGAAATLDPDQDLISTGIVDSLAIIKLVTFVESTFGVEIPDEDIVPEHFESLNALKSYIEGARAGKADGNGPHG